MPSSESLLQQKYYAHPRNSFWPIMVNLLNIDDSDYAGRAAKTAERGFAVWDVLKACVRPGSLDSNIDEKSIIPNDFPAFFSGHPNIERVFFNGAKSELVYRRHVLPGLPPYCAGMKLERLPSTSPAHASMSIAAKLNAWRTLLKSEIEDLTT